MIKLGVGIDSCFCSIYKYVEIDACKTGADLIRMFGYDPKQYYLISNLTGYKLSNFMRISLIDKLSWGSVDIVKKFLK